MNDELLEAVRRLMVMEQGPRKRYLLRVRESLEMVPFRGDSADNLKVLYVIICLASQRVKIGITQDIAKRLVELQTGSPTELRVLELFLVEGDSVEKYLHRKFARFNTHGEWFEWNEQLRVEIGLLHYCRDFIGAMQPAQINRDWRGNNEEVEREEAEEKQEQSSSSQEDLPGISFKGTASQPELLHERGDADISEAGGGGCSGEGAGDGSDI